MLIDRIIRRAIAASVLLAAGAAPAITAPAVASTPLTIWQEADKLQLLCILVSDRSKRVERERTLCDQARSIAAAGAPFPVEVIAPGDPAVLSASAVTLLVHAAEQPESDLLAFTVRPYRTTAEGGPLFGTAPRAASLSKPGALDTAMASALREALPWLPQQNGPRPLR